MKKVYLSSEANKALTTYLAEAGYIIETVNYEGITYYPVCTHPDIFMCRLGLWENSVIFPGNPKKLQPKYPGNIIYNAVCTGRYFIHNLKYTDHALLTAATEWKMSHNDSAVGFAQKNGESKNDNPSESAAIQQIYAGDFTKTSDIPNTGRDINYKNNLSSDIFYVDVPQGYTRCCLLPVDDTSFITSDNGIAKALIAAGADVLTIEQGHIQLTGFNYGFIGGCAGHIMLPYQPRHESPDSEQPCHVHHCFGTNISCNSSNFIRITNTSGISSTDTADSSANMRKTIIFNGNLSAHPDFEAITDFIIKHSIDIIYFENYPLTDIGSILALW